jgi:hypothetical protein
MPTVFFKSTDDETLFQAPLDAVPRVGEHVSFSFEPHVPEDWHPEIRSRNEESSRRILNWVVIDVIHFVRTFRADRHHHAIYCVIKPEATYQVF